MDPELCFVIIYKLVNAYSKFIGFIVSATVYLWEWKYSVQHRNINKYKR